MAAPIFLQSKATIVINENGGEAAQIKFQSEEIKQNNIYYRYKSVTTGEVITKEDVDILKYEESGVFYTYTISLENSMRSFMDGSTLVYLSISTDNSHWSSSIPLSLISKPSFQISPEQRLAENSFHIRGELSFTQEGETDFLDTYQLEIREHELQTAVEFTPILSPREKNAFNYEINAALDPDLQYDITVYYWTNKGYKGEQTLSQVSLFTGTVIENSNSNSCYIINDLSIKPEISNGTVILKQWTLEGALQALREATFFLERAASVDNYIKWTVLSSGEINCNDSFEGARLSLTAYDKYLEPNMGYKYRLRLLYRDQESLYQLVSSSSDIVCITGDDTMLLDAKGNYVTIKFNPKISSYKYEIKESITATIGGKFPVIRRNGKQRYRSFSISGLISSEGENSINNLIPADASFSHLSIVDQSFMKERLFRENVLNFLLNEDIKIYHSITEGAMLIRLSNVTFTPNATLGRKLWEFSAQAIEVEDYTPKGLSKYNFNIPEAESELIAIRAIFVPGASVSAENEELNIENLDLENGAIPGAELRWAVKDENGQWQLVED